jgi:hypothetical protein
MGALLSVARLLLPVLRRLPRLQRLCLALNEGLEKLLLSLLSALRRTLAAFTRRTHRSPVS